MKIVPATGSEWLGMLLVPFKAFVPVGYLMVVIQRETPGYRMDGGEVTSFVLNGYIISFLVLAAGAMIQRSIAPRRAYLWTCAFVASVFFFGWLLLPYLANI